MNIIQPILDFFLKVFSLRPTQLTIALLTIGLGVSLGFNYKMAQENRADKRSDKVEIDSLRSAIVTLSIAHGSEKEQIYKNHYLELRKLSEENDKKLRESEK